MLKLDPIFLHFSQIIGASKSAIRGSRQINPGVYSCGHQGSEIFMNFINPHYPGHDNVAGTCHFRILPNRPEICQVNHTQLYIYIYIYIY